MNVSTGSAIVESIGKSDVLSSLQLFSIGLCSGILFITGVFLFSLAMNVFFDILRK